MNSSTNGGLTHKRVLLGVSGGIAAYKSAELARRLRDAGAEVRVAMTRGATQFITPLTMQAVSGNRVHLELLDLEAEAGMSHIELGRWADAVLVAPASANFIARLAQGLADDLLATVCLATAAPVALAPAMNRQMWTNAATQANVAALAKRGVRIWGPGEGAQACGEKGSGRMLEPGELVSACANLFETRLLEGRRVVVTAGPTWEAWDPVRGITNRSSGRMGYAVAIAAAEAGARVTLISGPSAFADPDRVHTVRVRSAQEMLAAVLEAVREADIFVGAAAVADYRPAEVVQSKVKKGAERIQLELVRNPDILATVAALKPAPFTVGFAAETHDLLANARAKLVNKKLDLVAANVVGEGVGFETEDNRLTLVDAHGMVELPMSHKSQLARLLIQHIAERYEKKSAGENT